MDWEQKRTGLKRTVWKSVSLFIIYIEAVCYFCNYDKLHKLSKTVVSRATSLVFPFNEASSFYNLFIYYKYESDMNYNVGDHEMP